MHRPADVPGSPPPATSGARPRTSVDLPSPERAPPPATEAPRSWMPRVAVGLALGLLTFLAFGLWADLGRLGEAASRFAWGWMFPVLALSLANYGLRFVRWEIYLRAAGIRVPVPFSAGVFASGLAMSITPGKLGEILKAALLRDGAGVPAARSFPVVVTERLADLVAILALAGVGLAVGLGNTGVMLAGAGLTLAMFLALATGPGTRLTFRAFALLARRKLPESAFQEAREAQLRLWAPLPLVTGILLGTLAWFAEAAGLYVVVSAFPDSSLGLAPATFIYAVGTLAGALSFLPGGLVATEAALAVLLAAQAFPGVEPAAADVQAVASTLLIRLATLWFAVALGGVGLLWLGARRKASRS